MKVLKVFALAGALSAVAGVASADDAVVHDRYAFDAQQLIPVGVRAEVGTTGYGGALLWQANPYVGLALGYNGGDISWSDDVKVNGSKYDLDMDNKNVYLNAELRPWGASDNRWAQALYMAAGVGYLDNDYGLKARAGSANDTVTIDGWRYNGPGEVNGKLDYSNNIAPYVGFGFSPKINKNWGLFGEIGAYYTGNPNVKLQATGLTALDPNAPSAQDSANADAQKIRNDDKYKWLPVGKVGVSYNW
ncbi:ornithine uptake porin CarO [uncultured Acinetobacter sp.]|uniref:ornithine uptake porin CarO n=2 Tax=uncultured Acinetobacter sp. TaxID=165433 RepID=UPI002583096D|nr:ornithine uptake porin CarO [uncultured Acinetobacter sp.]